MRLNVHPTWVKTVLRMDESDVEVERLWEGEEEGEGMDDEDKDWLIQRLREKDIHTFNEL